MQLLLLSPSLHASLQTQLPTALITADFQTLPQLTNVVWILDSALREHCSFASLHTPGLAQRLYHTLRQVVEAGWMLTIIGLDSTIVAAKWAALLGVEYHKSSIQEIRSSPLIVGSMTLCPLRLQKLERRVAIRFQMDNSSELSFKECHIIGCFDDCKYAEATKSTNPQEAFNAIVVDDVVRQYLINNMQVSQFLLLCLQIQNGQRWGLLKSSESGFRVTLLYPDVETLLDGQQCTDYNMPQEALNAFAEARARSTINL